MRRVGFIWAAFVFTLCLASTSQATIIGGDLDGQGMPDTNQKENPAAAVGTWDLYVPTLESRGDGTGETPFTSNNHGYDNFLGPSDSVTIGTVTYHPPSGTPRGVNSDRPITGDPTLATGVTGEIGITAVHYEPLSKLGTGNYGFFMSKNDGQGISAGNWTDFKMSLGSVPASSNQITVSSRFKVDFANNGSGLGNGILSLVTPNNETVVLAVKNFSAPNDDHYGLELYRYSKTGGDTVLLANVQNINSDPIHPTASVHTSPGYFSVKMYSDSATHQALVTILDETSHYAHNYTFDITDPNAGANPALNGSVEFGAGLRDFSNPNAELKMIFDKVRVETGNVVGAFSKIGDMNGDGVLNNFDIPAFELALTDGAAYQSKYSGLMDWASRGDMNGDGRLDNFDIPGFERALTSSPVTMVPEPSTIVLLALGVLCGAGLVMARPPQHEFACSGSVAAFGQLPATASQARRPCLKRYSRVASPPFRDREADAIME